MTSIKLEVGKAYRNRNGEIVTIVAENPGEIMQFVDSDGETYRSDGAFVAGYCSLSDLVEEFTHFRTQQEIFKYLANGWYISNLVGERFLVGFNAEGILCRYDVYGTQLEEDSWYFASPNAWTIAVPKASEWYDNIPEQGVLCWCDSDDMFPDVRIIVGYRPNHKFYKYVDVNDVSYVSATPMTAEEIAKYIPEKQNETN